MKIRRRWRGNPKGWGFYRDLLPYALAVSGNMLATADALSPFINHEPVWTAHASSTSILISPSSAIAFQKMNLIPCYPSGIIFSPSRGRVLYFRGDEGRDKNEWRYSSILNYAQTIWKFNNLTPAKRRLELVLIAPSDHESDENGWVYFPILEEEILKSLGAEITSDGEEGYLARFEKEGFSMLFRVSNRYVYGDLSTIRGMCEEPRAASEKKYIRYLVKRKDYRRWRKILCYLYAIEIMKEVLDMVLRGDMAPHIFLEGARHLLS